MTEERKKELEGLIEGFKKQLTGDMFADMSIKEEIHRLEMELNDVKPESCAIDCENCGS